MKIITIIGTRPQYIKLKSLYDYFKKNNIDNYIIDTNQHYSDNVSKNLIKELELEIDCSLGIKFTDEISFMSNGICSIYNKLRDICGAISIVLVMGDTNSTFISSLVAKKMGLRLAHIEAGVRCYDNNSPEEINRILVDSIADIHFTSREKDGQNVSNPVYVGDLEYNFLNSIESRYNNVSYDGPILMTIHRQENMDINKLKDIFIFCEKLAYPIDFPIHHRTKKFIIDNEISIPKNVITTDSLTFFQVIDKLRTCRSIITDSGGITKTAPFFGKKIIVPMDKWEWDEVFREGYAINRLNHYWFDDYKMDRRMDLYYVANSCEIIVNKILENK